MRIFKFIFILYSMPVFFFILAISPNINGDRIGVVLLSVLILLVPAANYMAANPGKQISDSGDIKYSFIDSLALIMIIVAIYLGWNISWQFNLLQGLYLFAVVLSSKQEKYVYPGFGWFLVKLLIGIILFAAIYMGLNQYGFNNLLRTHIILFASLSTLLIIVSLYIANLREYYLPVMDKTEELPQAGLSALRMIIILLGLILLTYGMFFISAYHWRYAGYFGLVLLPAIIITVGIFRRLKSRQSIHLTAALLWLNIILASGLVLFFIYFFLDSTQILQAIMGGY
jgi:hypothetical protein